MPLAAFVASRAVVLFAAFAVRWSAHGRPLLDVLGGWDGGWYRNVARNGYPATALGGEGDAAQTTLGFFPLYPLLTRWVAEATGLDLVVVGVVVNTAAAALAVALLWRLAEQRWGRAVANRAALLVCFFPGSYALSLTYTEGVFLAGAAACLLLLERGRWWAAAAVGAVASASRPTGYVFALCCAFAVVQHWRRTRGWRPLLSVPLAAAGFLAFLVYLHVHTGDAFAWQRAQERGWGQRLDFGKALATRTWNLLATPTDDPTIVITTLALVALVALAVVFARARPPGLWVVYVAAAGLPGLLSSGVVVTPRFVLTLFPMLLTAAAALRHEAFAVVLAVSAALLGLFVFLLGTGWLTP